MKSLVATLCLLLVLGHSGAGAAASQRDGDPSAFIAKLGERVMAILESPGKSANARRLAIREVFDQTLDYQHMARQVLGRFWMRVSESERREFQQLFRDHVVATYSAQFEKYRGERFEILKHATWSDATVTVWTVLKKRSGDALPMNFRLRRREGKLLIFDLVVRGVSHVLIKRSEFSSVIINHGLDALFARLRAGRRVQLRWSRLAVIDRSTVLARIVRVATTSCIHCASKGARSTRRARR